MDSIIWASQQGPEGSQVVVQPPTSSEPAGHGGRAGLIKPPGRMTPVALLGSPGLSSGGPGPGKTGGRQMGPQRLWEGKLGQLEGPGWAGAWRDPLPPDQPLALGFGA